MKWATRTSVYLVQRYLPLASALQVKTAPAAFFPVVPAAEALQKVPAVTVPDEPFVVFVVAAGFVVPAAFVVAVLAVVFVAFTVVAGALTVVAVALAGFVVLVAANTGVPDASDPTRTKQATALSRRKFIESMLRRSMQA